MRRATIAICTLAGMAGLFFTARTAKMIYVSSQATNTNISSADVWQVLQLLFISLIAMGVAWAATITKDGGDE